MREDLFDLYSIHFAAHYADVEHEILKVKNGYRLALVYSLCWVDGNGNYKLNSSESTYTLSLCLRSLTDKNYRYCLL